MNTQPMSTAHASDGELIQLIDAEHDVLDPSVEQHVAACGECAARRDRYVEQSRTLSSWLATTDLPAIDASHIHPSRGRSERPRTRVLRGAPWRNRRLQIAAALFVAAGAAAASPAGKWVFERVLFLTASLRQSEQPVGTTTDTLRVVDSIEQGGSSVSFAAQSSTLSITIPNPGGSGSIQLVSTEDTLVRARLVRGARSTTLLVLPGELRIQRDGGERVDMIIDIPLRVRNVSIRIGNRVERVELGGGETRVVRW